MGSTSITISEEAKESLEEMRDPDHESWSELICDLNEIIPRREQIDTKLEDSMVEWRGKLLETGGVIQFFHDEVGGGTNYHSIYYPLLSDAAEAKEKAEHMAPKNPDEIIVGGADEKRATVDVDSLSMMLHGETFEVTFTIPSAFTEKDEGGDFVYIGEPVYVRNNGDVVQQGVIESIFHEESNTTFGLSHSAGGIIAANHPDPSVREQYEEHRAEDSQ